MKKITDLKNSTNDLNCNSCYHSRKGKPDFCAFNPPMPVQISRINPLTQLEEFGITGIMPPILEKGVCGRYEPLDTTAFV